MSSVMISVLEGLSNSVFLNSCFSFVVFVGSAEKRAYLLQRFPQLLNESIANSRDTTFEQHVLLHTQGKGQKAVTDNIALLNV